MALCGFLAACSAMVIETPLLFTNPGKYKYHNCDQLNAAARGQADREQELKRLIEKANEGAAGAVVATVAYRADYIAAGEERRLIESTAREKNCVTPSTWQSNTIIR
jgi:hypothetical protein